MKLRIVVMVVLMTTGLVGAGAAAIAAPIPGTPAISFEQSTGYSNSSGGGGVGFYFTPDIDMVVNQLGYFDFGDVGFDGSHFVGIYNWDGNYIASTTVTGSGQDQYIDSFWYAALMEPVTLKAETTYFILGEAGTDNYVVNTNGFITNDIQYLGHSFYRDLPPEAGLEMDELRSYEYDEEVEKYFGPNFRYTAVPIPSGIWLLGSGLLFLVGRKKRSTFSS